MVIPFNGYYHQRSEATFAKPVKKCQRRADAESFEEGILNSGIVATLYIKKPIGYTPHYSKNE